MSRLNVDALHSEDGGSSNIELDDSRNTTCKGNLTVDGNISVTGTGLTDTKSFRNILINGASLISQNNGTTSVSGEGQLADMWKVSTTASANSAVMQVVNDGPVGFQYSQKITMGGSTWSPAAGNICYIQQNIEAGNAAQLAFGTSDAKTVTLSFWVKASQTGEYSVALTNNTSAYVHDNADRNYITSYTISSANTWERKSVTIAGDTSGTWAKTGVGSGMACVWDFGSGTNHEASTGSWQAGADFRKAGTVGLGAVASATWQITGAQLEVGSSMTDFEHIPIVDEAVRCYRYYWTAENNTTVESTAFPSGVVFIRSASTVRWLPTFPIQMRSRPSITGTGVFRVYDGSNVNTFTIGSSGTCTGENISKWSSIVSFSDGAGSDLTLGRAGQLYGDGTNAAKVTFDASL